MKDLIKNGNGGGTTFNKMVSIIIIMYLYFNYLKDI